MSKIVVDDLRAGPGEMDQGFVVVDESASGVTVRVPTVVINGSGDGPTLLVTSGMHGDDLNTIPMVWRVADQLAPAELRGQVIAVPICNPVAFEAGSHLTPSDNKSLEFPGDETGTISQRIGYHLYHKIFQHGDYLLDMHGGSIRSTLAALAGFDQGASEQVIAEAKAMAEAFNPDLIIAMKPKGDGPPTGMFQVASRNGAPGLIVGMGQMGFNEEDTARGARGVFNVLRHLDMLDGEPEISVEPSYAGAEVYHHTPYGGGFFPEVIAAQHVEQGQPLGHVRDVFGGLAGEVKSKVSGMVVAIRFYPAVGAGDWVASVAEL